MKMDWQRTAYISGIFVLGFLLLFEWNAFNTKQQLEANKQKNTAVTTVRNSTNNSTVVPSIIEDAESTSELPVPAVTDSNDIPTVASNTVVTEAKNQGRLIHIRTNSVDVQIDRFGGDIVKVSLPKHKILLGGEEEYTLLNRTNNSIYVAESGLIGANGTDKSSTNRPLFSSEKNEYVLQEDESDLVVDLKLLQNGVQITKRFHFKRDDYLINIEYIIDNQTSSTWQSALYGQIRRDSQEPIAAADSGFGVNPYLGAATRTDKDNYNKLSFSDLEKEKTSFEITGGWIAMVQHYFVSAWIPNAETNNQYTLRKLKSKDIYLLSFSTPQVIVEPGQTGSLSAGFYVGPKDIKRLESISEYLDLTIDFGFLWWIAKPIFQILIFINSYIGNWGWSIIALTFLIKALFFYPSAVSYRSMAKMRKVSPKMQKLKDLYGDDKQKMSQEMMKLYKTEKVNPMGGCLPIIIQMPVFISLYWVLMESVELRHAPFMLWITDLSVKDPYFIFPLIMGLTMFIQQKLNPTPPDPMQAKIMQWMPVAFTFMFLWFPAGLVVYWVTNNTLSIIQQYLITRKIEAEG